MKKGDVVTIQDTSYSTSIIDGKLAHPGRGLRYKRCVIVETNCTFPKTSRWDGNNVNNTIIQVCETNQIIFIEERFLSPMLPKHEIMIDIIHYSGYDANGQIIKISDELYQEIKRES